MNKSNTVASWAVVFTALSLVVSGCKNEEALASVPKKPDERKKQEACSPKSQRYRLALECSRKARAIKARKEQTLTRMLATSPLHRSRTAVINRSTFTMLVRKDRHLSEVCSAVGCTMQQAVSLYIDFVKWEKRLLMTHARQLIQNSELIKKHQAMSYPIYLLDSDRDAAHNAIIEYNTIAAMRILEHLDPTLRNPMRAKRISDLADYIMKKQRGRIKTHMYRKLLSRDWGIDRCIDALGAYFTSYEVRRLKQVFCNPAFVTLPENVVTSILEYDEDLRFRELEFPY